MIEAIPNLTGAAGDAWLAPEPHPGHFLLHCPNVPAHTIPKKGRRKEKASAVTWFVLSVALEPHRVVLRGVDPKHEPNDEDELQLLADPILEIEVPAGVDENDFVQIPGALAGAIVRDVLCPHASLVVAWRTAVTRTIARHRKNRKGKAQREEVDGKKAADRLRKEARKRKRKVKKARRRP